MRMLTVDETAKSKVAKVIDWARQREHWYDPSDKNAVIPGNDPNLQVHLDTYRCVFSYTRSQGKLLKQLSISVPSEKFPNPIAAFTIAELFGFTDWDGTSMKLPESWMGGICKEDHCVILAQECEVEP